MSKQLITSQGSQSTNFTPVRIPVSIHVDATSAAKCLAPIPEMPAYGKIKAANAANADVAVKPRLRPRAVFSFTASQPSEHAHPSWVMDVGDGSDEDQLLEAASAAGQCAEDAAMNDSSKQAAKRTASHILPTITELLSEDEDDSALENGSAMLPRKHGLTRLPSFKLPSKPAVPASGNQRKQRRPLTRTATM